MAEYSLDPLQDGCYENSSVLINKFGIRDAQQLDIMEQSITSMLIAKAAIEIPFENVDFEFYKNCMNMFRCILRFGRNNQNSGYEAKRLQTFALRRKSTSEVKGSFKDCQT